MISYYNLILSDIFSKQNLFVIIKKKKMNSKKRH